MNLRLWRTQNLKFNQDDYGITKFKTGPGLNDFMLKICRTDVNIRTFNIFFGIGFISLISFLKGTFAEPENPHETARKQAEAKGSRLT